MRTFEERLAALERSAGRWKAATFCVAAIAGAALLLGAQKKEPEAQEEVRAQRFVLVSADGESLGVWTGDKDSAALGMQVGKQQVLLGILPGDGPSLDLQGERGKIGLLCAKTGPGIGVTAGETDVKIVANPRVAGLSLKRGTSNLALGAGDDVTVTMKKKGEISNAVFRKASPRDANTP
jgi:hypothetical protein